MKKMCLFFALAIFCFVLCAIFCTKAHSEIVIEKLEDPAYLNPSETSYTPSEKQNIQEQENSTGVATQTLYGSSISSATLSKIERKVFGRNFVGDNNLNRLSRLEQRVFGAVQRGETSNRVQRLKTATQSYTNNYAYAPNNYYRRTYPAYPNYGYGYYNNPYNMYTPYRPYKRTRLKNMFRALTGASLTGFSPPASDISEQADKIAQNSNGYTNSTIDPYTAYNSSSLQGYAPNSGYSNGYSWSNGYQNPYSGSTYSTYAGQNPQNNGYYTPANTANRLDIFSNGASGSETYYDDGRYRRNMSSTGGGCGVKIIY